jgi:hypothetical protein
MPVAAMPRDRAPQGGRSGGGGGDPRSGRGSVFFRAQATSAELKVMVSKDGSVIDHCDGWTTVKDGEGAAAVAVYSTTSLRIPSRPRLSGLTWSCSPRSTAD